MPSLAYPPREPLAHTPTPLQRLPRTSAELGVELWCKRDDLTGVELSGNKVRKLEFLIADAQAQGADTLITCGGEQSNHSRATALAAARMDMRAVLLLRTADPSEPPPTAGNILLDRLAGAEIVWIDHAAYARRREEMARAAERVRAAGGRPYVIPEGGSNPLGSWGYVAAFEEIARDLAGLPPKPTTVVYACGSGGTGAGLVLGTRLVDLAGAPIHITGINVCNDRAYFVDTIHRICGEFDRQFGTDAAIEPGDIDILDGYVGRGYGQSQPDELTLIRDLARREGLLLDPVYTGKAFYGLCRELERDRGRFGERVVFIHTGGLFRWFARPDEIEPLL